MRVRDAGHPWLPGPSRFPAALVLAAALGLTLQARGEHVVDSPEIQAAVAASTAGEDAMRTQVSTLLGREDVRRIAAGAGLDLARAANAAATLERPELEQLAARARAIEEQLAGGHTVVITTTTLLLAMLIALLIVL